MWRQNLRTLGSYSHFFSIARLRQFLLAETPQSNPTIPIACRTRWGSHLKTFEKLALKKSLILNIMKNPSAKDYIDDEVRKICFDNSFWTGLEGLIGIITPLSHALTVLEGDLFVVYFFAIHIQMYQQCSLSMEIARKNLRSGGRESDDNVFVREQRFDSFREIRTAVSGWLDQRWLLFAEYIHWAAYALDPRFRGLEGMELSDSELADAEYFIDKFSLIDDEKKEVRRDLIRFISQETIFSQVSFVCLFSFFPECGDGRRPNVVLEETLCFICKE